MIALNLRDGRPIYEQVRDKFRTLIIAGAIAPGEKLPSVREVAASLAINPNTIQRAFSALEAEGYVVTRAGKGVYAAEGERDDTVRRDDLFNSLDATVKELLFLGVTEAELAGRIKKLSGDREGGKAQ